MMQDICPALLIQPDRCLSCHASRSEYRRSVVHLLGEESRPLLRIPTAQIVCFTLQKAEDTPNLGSRILDRAMRFRGMAFGGQ